MSDFDKRLTQLLSEEDEAFIADAVDEQGYYSSVLKSFKGQGSAMSILTWVGIIIFGSLLIFSIWKFFQADTVLDQILFSASAIMLNSAQIALKLWFNMQLNRRTITQELRRLQLVMLKSAEGRG
jgi:hypothetical protein